MIKFGWLKNIFTPTRLIGLIALTLLLSVRLQDYTFVEVVRLQSFDYLQRAKPREYQKLPITIVDLDEASFRSYGQWPWPRTQVAELIDNLGKLGAVATAFDIVFAERDRLSPQRVAEDNDTLPPEIAEQLKQMPDNEVVMAEAMKRHRVVLGQTSVRQERDVNHEGAEIQDAGFAAIGPDPKQFIGDFPDLLQNVEDLEAAATGRGVFSIEPDIDAVFRRVPLVVAVRGKIRLALSAELLRIATGGESFAIRSNVGGVEGVVLARKLVNTDGQGKVWPYFTPSNPQRYVSAASILNGTVDPAKIRGHMIMVGTSAIGLEDYRLSPLGVTVPGVEIHTQVVENIMLDTMLKRPVTFDLIEMIISFIAGVLVILIVPKLGAVFSALAAIIAISGVLGLSWWRFAEHRELIDATFPIGTIIILFIITATANYIREEKERQQIRGAFGQYLSPALVDQLSDDPDRLVLGGETRELSVLFTDVRGFTGISESYKENPEGLTKLMNRFLNVLSKPILDRNGTIDKYMGDAIMAFWNAPVDEEKHAYHAAMSALEMIKNVDELNTAREQELAGQTDEIYLPINVGVGINTGPCTVGNMGSDIRFDYTALGDTVNLASRLEGQSKPYGLPIVIGENTASVIPELATYEIDLIRVKGKNEPARIYALAGDETYAQSDDFVSFRALNRTMLSAYRTQDWESAFEALELMEPLGEKLGITVEDYLFIYETRIADFRANPPGKSWDGVYTATSK